jgi:thioredoxin reductase
MVVSHNFQEIPMQREQLPVVILGAGPVGLAAAAHLLERGLAARVFEAGPQAGAGLARWGHVRMFSPWEFAVDAAARRLLERHGWRAPDPDAFPTGADLVRDYLAPLAATPEIAAALATGARVTGVARRRRDRMKNAGRQEAPFVVRYETAEGEHEILARAVIDASGTMETPNPLGASGLPARGERALRDRIAYGLPDVSGGQRARYASKRVLVLGSGHSAFNVLLDLARLAEHAPDTRIVWALRRDKLAHVLGGGENDQLQERGKLGLAIAKLVETGRLTVETGFELDALERTSEGIVARSGCRALAPVDEIIGATGFRPNLEPLSELRLGLDEGTQAPRALAPLIDPNLHSCGSVRPHGADVLSHPERDVYIVGMKSYGRAPTFLLLTGYEQVRSVAAAIAGDWEAARRVELVLPETGVCITQFLDEPQPHAARTNDCATPAPAHSAALATSAAGCSPACTPAPRRADATCCG